MDKKIRRQTKVKAKEHHLDLEEFNALTDLLFDLFKENHSACARVLGISRITWRSWETKPPTWPWWNIVLRHVIKGYLSSIAARRGLTKKHRKRILENFNKIPEGESFLDEIEKMAYDVAGAAAHLRRLLMRKGMFWDDIRAVANCGGYTQQSLRKAARQLGIVKTQEGYGEEKRSYWKLPDQDDD